MAEGVEAGRLYVVGGANMDLVVRAPRLPAAGETVIGSDMLQLPGGKGANQAVAAARLGAQVTFIGNVGNDAFGGALRQTLANDGVDVNRLKLLDERPSGVALIVVDDAGENLIAVGSGANRAVSPTQVETALATIGPSDVVLLQLEIPLDAVMRGSEVAHQAGARVLLNAAPAAANLDALLPLVSVLVVNAGEAELLSGLSEPEPAASALLERGPNTVIVTLGGEGLLLANRSGTSRVPAERVKVVDTTAAGDAFCGAFATALLEGQDALAAAEFANVAAALATTRLGAQASMPTRAEVDALTPVQPGPRESRT